MVPFFDWFPLALVGVMFATLGTLKVIGLHRGIIGGAAKPYRQRLMGSCPTWSRHVNVLLPFVFLGLGLWNLGRLAWLVLRR